MQTHGLDRTYAVLIHKWMQLNVVNVVRRLVLQGTWDVRLKNDLTHM